MQVKEKKQENLTKFEGFMEKKYHYRTNPILA